MFYNIKIKSNKGEYILESYDKDIIQREMDLYFASMFGASDEFKSKIKEIDIRSKNLESCHEIEELKQVRENVVESEPANSWFLDNVPSDINEVAKNTDTSTNTPNENESPKQSVHDLAQFKNTLPEQKITGGKSDEIFIPNEQHNSSQIVNQTNNSGLLNIQTNPSSLYANTSNGFGAIQNQPVFTQNPNFNIGNSLSANNSTLNSPALTIQSIVNENKAQMQTASETPLQNSNQSVANNDQKPHVEPMILSALETPNASAIEPSTAPLQAVKTVVIQDTLPATESNTIIGNVETIDGAQPVMPAINDFSKTTSLAEEKPDVKITEAVNSPNQIVFDDPQNPTSGFKIPLNHPDIQELNSIMPDIQLEVAQNTLAKDNEAGNFGVLNNIKAPEDTVSASVETILPTPADNVNLAETPVNNLELSEKQPEPVQTVDYFNGGSLNYQNETMPAQNEENTNAGLSEQPLEIVKEDNKDDITPNISEENSALQPNAQVQEFKENAETEQSIPETAPDISEKTSVIETDKKDIDIFASVTQEQPNNESVADNGTVDIKTDTKVEVQSETDKETTNEKDEEAVSVDNILNAINGEINSLDITKNNDIDGNLLTIFEDADAPTIEFSKKRLNKYANNDTVDAPTIDLDYKPSIFSEEGYNQGADLPVIEFDTIDVTTPGSLNDTLSATDTNQEQIIEPLVNEAPKLEIKQDESLQLENSNPQADTVESANTVTQPVPESTNPIIAEALNSIQQNEAKQETPATSENNQVTENKPVNNTEVVENVPPLKEPEPLVIDFKLYFTSFFTDLLIDKFVICAYYIKNILKQESFTIKFLNSKLFIATGEIANMAVVEELIAQNYIEQVPSDGPKKCYTISAKGEQYFKENLQQS